MTKHIFHYNTHSEQKYFLGPKHRKLYDIIALNGNIVSHTPSGVAAFLATAAKEFYIDPQTHAFQHSTSNLKRDKTDDKGKKTGESEFKPSVEKLAKERLGKPFYDVILNDKPIRTTVFLDERGEIKKKVIEEICNNVINFQVEFLNSELNEEEREFMEEGANLCPGIVIAPYFYFSSHNIKEWLKINIACCKQTKLLHKDNPIYLSLVISKDLLFKNSSQVLFEAIEEIKPDGILLWIDEHVEEELTEFEIFNFIEFLKNLRNYTGNIFNSHGGYLSTLLCHPKIRLLDALGHSANYGESRSVIPIGGGIPMARFYFPSIHSRLRFGDALAVIHANQWLSSIESYAAGVCKCAQCRELTESKDSLDEAFMTYGESKPVTFSRRNTIVELNYPTKVAKQAAARHYLYNKAHELTEIKEKNLEILLNELDVAFKEIEPISGDRLVSHLVRWSNSIKGYIEK